jgi:hypothetical protein
MSEWQPIETAPINVPVLVHMNGFGMSMSVMCKEQDGSWVEAAAYGRRLKDASLVTAWMPLPAPPEAK